MREKVEYNVSWNCPQCRLSENGKKRWEDQWSRRILVIFPQLLIPFAYKSGTATDFFFYSLLLITNLLNYIFYHSKIDTIDF